LESNSAQKFPSAAPFPKDRFVDYWEPKGAKMNVVVVEVPYRS
jgi:hypothetical protein